MQNSRRMWAAPGVNGWEICRYMIRAYGVGGEGRGGGGGVFARGESTIRQHTATGKTLYTASFTDAFTSS